ncbi:MAG: thioredoxin family protein [Acidobacteriota bacterium]
MTKHLRPALALVLLTGLVACGRLGGPVDDKVTWLSLEEGRAEATSYQAGKPLLYDFTAGWCPPCRQMSKEVFADQASADFINENFIPIKLLDEKAGRAERELAREMKIQSYPTLVVVRSDGYVIRRVGYAGRDATMDFLRRSLGES